MERLGKPRHGREGRRLSEREVSEIKSREITETYATGFLDSARNDFYDITLTVALAVNRFAQRLKDQSISLRRGRPEILQVNVGKLCNLTCVHCHVNAGPKRKEIMTRATIDRILDWLANTNIPTVDLTGGAPEMIPDFRYFIERVKELEPSRHVIDRCNLTILIEEGYHDLAELLAAKQVEIIASMPCYSAKNVNAQRGDGVFEGSIAALQLLNSLGYGIDPALPLHLVYNPAGDFLPSPQEELEADYKRELREAFRRCVQPALHAYESSHRPVRRLPAPQQSPRRVHATFDRGVQSSDYRRPNVPQHDQRWLAR